MKSAQPGFSLTEIIIALAIIGIMIAGTLGLTTYIGQARRRAAESHLRLYKNMIDQYRQDTSVYPASLSDLKDRPSEESIAKKWKGPYMEVEIQDPWGAEYQYVLNPKGSKPPYELYSFGSNGEGAAETEWIRA
jgi:general secretion pathway protein G